MKVWNYIIISVGLAFLFEIAGMPVATSLLEYLGLSATGFSIKTAAIWLAIFGGAGVLVGIIAGVGIGYLTKSPAENYIILPFITGGIVLFLSTFIGIVNYAIGNFPGWIATVTTFIMGILGVGFVIACVEFFRGTD